jgi:hypothetical protein
MIEPLKQPIIWHNEKRKLCDLIPYAHNPRVMTKQAAKRLKKSIEEKGYVEVIAINTDNVIVAGHQRYEVLKQLHSPDFEVDVRVPNRELTDKEFKEYLIGSNKDRGDFDYDVLASVWGVEELVELGFTDKELGLDVNLDDELNDTKDEKKDEKEWEYEITVKCKDIHDKGDICIFLDSFDDGEVQYKVKS